MEDKPEEQKTASLLCPEPSCDWTADDELTKNTDNKTDSMTQLEMLKTHIFYKHKGKKFTD